MPRHVNIVPKYRKKTVGGNCYAVVDICGHVHHLGRYNSKPNHIEYDRLIAEWPAAIEIGYDTPFSRMTLIQITL